VPSVAFYISGHGFGHASRQIEIINALGPLLPAGFVVVVRTSAARWLFDRTLTTAVTLLPGDCDTGIVQIDSLRLDESATVRKAAEFYAGIRSRTAAEGAILQEHDTRLVVCDAPPLACSAASAIGIPSIVVSNFTWDWIYEGYEQRFAAEAPGVLGLIRDAYATASAGWRLPMHGGFATIAPIVDLPLVARHATRSREETLEALRLPSGRPLALSSFGGYGLSGFDLASLDCLDSWTVVITGQTPMSVPPGIALVEEAQIYDRGLRYEDLVAAVDVVVTKPGYGIISECIANGTALLYTSRGHFAEYDTLVREMPRLLRCAYLDQESLLAGRWRQALDALLACPAPAPRPATDGAQVAAAAITHGLHGYEHGGHG
jgi:L-arabinokinase